MATNEVTLRFPNADDDFRRLYYASDFAIEIKHWLEEQGLVMNVDFQWTVDPDAREITFTFNEDTGWVSLVGLKFSDK